MGISIKANDFLKIAEVIDGALHETQINDDRYRGVEFLARQLANAFEKESEYFDRELFLQTCGLLD